MMAGRLDWSTESVTAALRSINGDHHADILLMYLMRACVEGPSWTIWDVLLKRRWWRELTKILLAKFLLHLASKSLIVGMLLFSRNEQEQDENKKLSKNSSEEVLKESLKEEEEEETGDSMKSLKKVISQPSF